MKKVLKKSYFQVKSSCAVQWDDAFIFCALGYRKNICCQKIFGSFQATEMVLTSKWGRIQPEIKIWPDQVVAGSRTLAGSPWKGAEMLSELRSPMTPSSPTTPYLLTGRSNRRVWGVKLVLFWVCWILLFQGGGEEKGAHWNDMTPKI